MLVNECIGLMNLNVVASIATGNANGRMLGPSSARPQSSNGQQVLSTRT